MFADQYATLRIVERSAPADPTGRVKVGGVNVLPISEFVAGALRRIATTVRSSPDPC